MCPEPSFTDRERPRKSQAGDQEKLKTKLKVNGNKMYFFMVAVVELRKPSPGVCRGRWGASENKRFPTSWFGGFVSGWENQKKKKWPMGWETKYFEICSLINLTISSSLQQEQSRRSYQDHGDSTKKVGYWICHAPRGFGPCEALPRPQSCLCTWLLPELEASAPWKSWIKSGDWTPWIRWRSRFTEEWTAVPGA